MKTSLKQRPLELSPTIKPFAIGVDHLAEKTFELIQLLKGFNLSYSDLTRATAGSVSIYFDEIEIELKLEHGVFFVYGMNDIVNLLETADHDSLSDGLISIDIYDDYFCDWDCEY